MTPASATNEEPSSPRPGPTTSGIQARRLAIRALVRIEKDGAYANLVLPPMLDKSNLSDRDRRLVTHLVYGTTRMRRACDFLVDRFLLDEVDTEVRAALRLGAYQLFYLDTPAHAAVSATVGAVRGRGRSVVNAVLRRVADSSTTDSSTDSSRVDWPDEPTRLSYPDWVAASFRKDLGAAQAERALVAMNEPATVHTRDDGYVQDPASQLVVDAVGARRGELVIDLCAAPGGKATAIVESGATVVAADLRPNRARLISRNATAVGARLPVLVGDGRAPGLRPGQADRVLIDAPCSGLGSLRRRPDARWRIDVDAPKRLADLQLQLVLAGLELLRPGGVLTYSVCTLTGAETTGVLSLLRTERPEVELLGPPVGPWEHKGAVGYMLPGAADGMSLWQVQMPV